MPVLLARPWKTAKVLSTSLGIRRRNPYYHPLPRDGVAINWGCTGFRVPDDVLILNHPDSVANAVNKLTAFYRIRQVAGEKVPLPKFTEDRAEALTWYDEGRTIYGRTLLRAKKGAGIYLFHKDRPGFHRKDSPFLEQVRLFTQFWKADKEVRVHVFRGEVIDYVQKMRKRMDNPPQLRHWIRNHTFGWIFGRTGVERHELACRVAIDSVNSLGLDFGAVDVRIRDNRAVVLEINTAPALEGTTLEAYKRAIKNYIQGVES